VCLPSRAGMPTPTRTRKAYVWMDSITGGLYPPGRRHDLRPAATRLGIDTAKLELAHFRTVRIIPVARRNHPLAAGVGPVPRALLRAHAQIVLRDRAQRPDAPSLNVVEGVLRWSVTDVAAKKEVILAGMGWWHARARRRGFARVCGAGGARGTGVRGGSHGAVRDAEARSSALGGSERAVGGAEAERRFRGGHRDAATRGRRRAPRRSEAGETIHGSPTTVGGAIEASLMAFLVLLMRRSVAEKGAHVGAE
jgi:hypothetical protein